MRIASALLLSTLFVAASASAQTLSAEDVLRAHVDAVGGEEALAAITSRYSRAEVTLELPVGPIIVAFEQWISFPGHGLIKQKGLTAPPEVPLEMLEQTVYMTADGGWVDSPQMGGRINLSDLPAAQAAGLDAQRRQLAGVSEELNLLTADTLEVSLGENETVRGAECRVVQIAGEFPQRRMYAVDTGLLAAVEVTTPMGTSTQYVSDYRTVSGVRVPFVVETTASGAPALVTFSDISFDREITAESIQAEAEGKEN